MEFGSKPAVHQKADKKKQCDYIHNMAGLKNDEKK